MRLPEGPPPSPALRRRRALGLGALLVLAVQAWLLAIGVNPLPSGDGWNQLWDPDSYARMLRLQALAGGGGWFDGVARWANYPAGFTLHWSRLLDLLVLVPAKVAAIAVAPDAALLGSALALGPVLQLAALAALAWGTRRFLSARQLLLVAALFATQRGISYDFLPGLVDHHGLQILLLVVSLAALYREPHDSRAAFVAGAAGGLAFWDSAENLVVVAALVVALGVAWILDDRAADGRRLLRYGAALTVSTAAAIACELPASAWLAPRYDALSIVHLAVAAAVAVAGASLALLTPTRAAASPARRLGAALATGIGAGGVLLLLFPALVRNPYAATAPAFQLLLLRYLPAEQLFLPTRPDSAYNFVLEIGPGLLALGYCGWRLAARAPLDAAARTRYAISSAALAVFVAYAVYAFRGVPFVAAATTVPWAEAISAAWARARAAPPGASRLAKGSRLLLPAAAALGFWAVAWTIGAAFVPLFFQADGKEPACRWDLVAQHIPPAPQGAFRRAVLTGVLDGPEVAYRTGRPVLGAPYQDNADGIVATFRILASPPERALPLIDARGVEWIALCGNLTVDVADVLRASPLGLGRRLLSRIPTPGLAEVPLPPDLAGRFVLFRREAPGPSAAPPPDAVPR